MSEQTNGTVAHHIDLPDDALPVAVFEIVEYLDAEGNRVYAYRHAGASNVSTAVGLIELAKHNLMSRTNFE